MATLSVLLLLAGVAVARDLEGREQRHAQFAGLRLRATVDGIELRDTTVRARLVLFPDSPLPLELQGVTLDAGWRLAATTASLPSGLEARSARSFVLQHDVDCSPGALRLPATVSLRVATEDRETRVLDAAVEGPDDPGPSPLELACGTLPPEGAVTLLASSIVRAAGRTTVALRLADRAPREVVVVAITYGGFAITAVPSLPFTLRGRAAGAGGALVSQVLTLTLRVVDCDDAAAALTVARQVSPPDLLPLDLATRAMTKLRVSTRSEIDVPGLTDYLVQEREAACGGGTPTG